MPHRADPIVVLGIETSCDETAAGVVIRHGDGRGEILSNVVHAQLSDHAAYGGVVPEIAARSHVRLLDRIVASALADAGVDFSDLDALAVTAGPGLIGGLTVGVATAQAVAYARGLPLYAINHLEGHALSVRLVETVAFPFLLLLVSGGHTQFLAVEGVGDYRRWGTTVDDAAGEAFDKTAKLLGLGYPGGPRVEAAARRGDPSRFALPRPLADRPDLALSFAGLKTAVRRTHALAAASPGGLQPKDTIDLAASFEAAVVDVLGLKAGRALARFGEAYPWAAPRFVVAGGVAANEALRMRLGDVAQAAGARLFAPPLHLCGDNGAMIAWAACERIARELPPDGLRIAARARWPLDREAIPVVGHGKRGAKA